MQLLFDVDKQRLTYLGRRPIVSGTLNYLTAKFSFTDDWQDVERYAQFVKGDYAGIFRLDNNGDVCYVPWEVVNCRGQFTLTVFGVGPINNKIITGNSVVINVEQNGRDDIQSEYPTQDYLSKILLDVVVVGEKLEESIRTLAKTETLAKQAKESADASVKAKDSATVMLADTQKEVDRVVKSSVFFLENFSVVDGALHITFNEE